MLYAFLDTTALHRAYTLRGTQWDSVAQAIGLGLAQVVVSDVSVAEIVRQAAPEARETNNRISAAVREAAQFGVTLTADPIPDDEGIWDARFRRSLAERGITVIAHAQPQHGNILARDLAVTPPFKKSGEGYRDTLIRLTFLEWLATRRPGENDRVFFVSANTRQFAGDGEKNLHPALQTEVAAITDTKVQLIPNRTDFVDAAREHIRELHAGVETTAGADLESRIEAGAMAAATRIIGTSFDAYGNLELEGVRVYTELELPHVPDASIEWVEPVENFVEATRVDTLDELTELWSVNVVAEVWAEGTIHKDDYPSMSALVEVRDRDLYRYMQVTFQFSVRLRYDVRIERGDETVRAELVEAAIVEQEVSGVDGW